MALQCWMSLERGDHITLPEHQWPLSSKLVSSALNFSVYLSQPSLFVYYICWPCAWSINLVPCRLTLSTLYSRYLYWVLFQGYFFCLAPFGMNTRTVFPKCSDKFLYRICCCVLGILQYHHNKLIPLSIYN